MRNTILAAILLVWGAAVLINALAGSGPSGSGAYNAGQWLGIAFGAVMVFAGGRHFVRGR